MNTGSLNLTNAASKERHYIRLKDYLSANQNIPFTYLYIGNREEMDYPFLETFQSGQHLKSLEQGLQFLQSCSNGQRTAPDVLFLDLPFSKEGLLKLKCRIKNEYLVGSLLFIYNDAQLNGEEKEILRQENLVDEVLLFDDLRIDYRSKLELLKSVKEEEEKKQIKKQRRIWKRRNLRRAFSKGVKRTVDIIFASLALLVLSPVMLLIALILKFESRGPVLYVSQRAGKGFKLFRFYKFRSMIADADKKVAELSHLNQYDVQGNGPTFFKIHRDPRITRFGKFLRNSSLDELPQLYNVLIGDMSLVGNRPLPIYEAISLTTNEFVERFSAPAGITGLWQVKKRGKSDMSVEERIQLDIDYAQGRGLRSDFKIILHTPIALFQKSDV